MLAKSYAGDVLGVSEQTSGWSGKSGVCGAVERVGYDLQHLGVVRELVFDEAAPEPDQRRLNAPKHQAPATAQEDGAQDYAYAQGEQDNK